MDVSIIIVNYNQGKLLRECITSVLKHTSEHIDIEFLVIDNHSEKEDVDPFLVDLPKVTLVKNRTNNGFAAANNQGLQLARGRFVLILNNDTLFTEDTLQKCLDFYAASGGNAMIGCKLLNADESHQFSVFDYDSLANKFGEYFFLAHLFPKSASFNKFHLNYKIPDSTAQVDVIKGAFMFAETEVMRALRGFDENFFFYNEENDLCWRFRQEGGVIWYFPDTSIIHLGGATTESMSYFSVQHLALSYLIYFRKHFGPAKRTLFYAMHYSGWFVRVPVYCVMGLLMFDKKLFAKAWNYFRATFQRAVYDETKASA